MYGHMQLTVDRYEKKKKKKNEGNVRRVLILLSLLQYLERKLLIASDNNAPLLSKCQQSFFTHDPSVRPPYLTRRFRLYRSTQLVRFLLLTYHADTFFFPSFFIIVFVRTQNTTIFFDEVH